MKSISLDFATPIRVDIFEDRQLTSVRLVLIDKIALVLADDEQAFERVELDLVVISLYLFEMAVLMAELA